MRKIAGDRKGRLACPISAGSRLLLSYFPTPTIMSRVPDIRNAMIIVYIIAIITFDYFHVFLLDLLNMLGGPMQES